MARRDPTAWKTSKAGRDLIRHFEDVGLQAVPDARGDWVVGYGHRERVVEGVAISADEADGLFRLDLERAERAVRRLVRVPVTATEYDALVSLAFELGPEGFEASRVLHHLNDGARDAAVDALLRLTPGAPAEEHAAGTQAAKRRIAEAALFKTPPARDRSEDAIPDPRPAPAHRIRPPAPHASAAPQSPRASLRLVRSRLFPGLIALLLLVGLSLTREVAEIVDLGNLDHPLVNSVVDAFVLWPRTAYLALALAIGAAAAYVAVVAWLDLRD